MQLLYSNGKVQKQCTDLKTARKLFGGNSALAISLFARINAMQQANVIRDIVMMPTFHFHKLSGNMNGYFAMNLHPHAVLSRVLWRWYRSPSGFKFLRVF